MKKLFTILALALAMVACQKDGNVEEFSNGDLATVTLNLDAPALGVTRAGDNGQDDATNGKESAYGAIDYADDAFWAKYDLRYILEVYSAEDDGTGENIARERLYSFKSEYEPTQFQVRLVPNRTYKFVVWADFVLHTTAADGDFDNDDLYYNTADLRAIKAITTGDWNAMNEARDAYFVSQNLDIKKDVAQNLTLKRPLAKIRVVTTDKEHWAKYSQPSRVEVKYYESELSNVFNAVNGQIDTTQPLQKLTYDVVYADAESQYNETATHKTLFADYLFVKPAADGQTPIHFTMDVYEGDNHDVLVRSNDFCTEIPIKRNHLTTIYGDILTTMSDITVGINDNFDLENVDIDYKEDEHSNDAGNSAPVLKPEGENAEGVTEVSYANGAYTIATAEGIDVNIKVSALTEGKLAAGVYTYGVDFTVDDFDYAVPATAAKFNQTAAATVKATVVGGTMEVLYKTSGEQVINLELDITYEANDTVVEATAAYSMTSKFEFAEIEQVALAAPVVEATVSENTVTLTWAKVDNAANYSITVGTEMPVFTEECTYTFTGEYDTDYVFYVVAVPADELLYLPSAAAKVEARTAKEVTDDPQPEVKTYYVYVDEQNGWSHVYLYAWWGTAEDECIVGWPGTELTDTKNIDGVVYLVYAIPAEHNGKTLQFIVNNGEDKQTPNSEQYLIDNDVFLTVEAEVVDVPEKPWEPAAEQLVFEPHGNWTQANARFAAYFFGTDGEAWSGMIVVPGKPGIYYTTKPAGAFENVIFCRMNPSASANNWNNKWNQTGDLVIPTDGKNYYRLTGGEWDGVTGSWSKYTVDYTPTKLNAPRVNAAVEGNVVTLSWNAVANAEYYTVNDVKAASPYVFEGEYNTPYTFSVVSCSDDARFAASDAVVVEVTTEAEAVVEPTVVALDAPEVTVSVDVNVVTLTWEAVAGASHYTVQVDDDVEEVVNATSYVFEGDYEVEYMFTVKAIAADTTVNTDSEATVVKATTEAKPSDAPTETVLTVAEFLALTDVVPSDATAEEIAAAPRYTLTGTITSVTNSTYGNFYLNDGTGEVLIYGLVGPEGESKYWATSGAKVGDDITVKTIRTEYGNSPQGKNATFVEVKTPGTLAFWSFEATSASFTASADVKQIKVDIYNATSEVVATSDNAQFSAAYANGVLTVSALENTSSDLVEGNITVTCGTLSQVITVSQLGASSGDQTAVDATISFADKAYRTEYTTSQQVWEQNGITVTNDKASSTTNVGDYANPGRFYKGSDVTIEAPGAIVSISINVSGLDSKYVTPWGTANNGIVTISLDGTSNTYKFTNLSAQARANSITVTYLK